MLGAVGSVITDVVVVFTEVVVVGRTEVEVVVGRTEVVVVVGRTEVVVVVLGTVVDDLVVALTTFEYSDQPESLDATII